MQKPLLELGWFLVPRTWSLDSSRLLQATEMGQEAQSSKRLHSKYSSEERAEKFGESEVDFHGMEA